MKFVAIIAALALYSSNAIKVVKESHQSVLGRDFRSLFDRFDTNEDENLDSSEIVPFFSEIFSRLGMKRYEIDKDVA